MRSRWMLGTALLVVLFQNAAKADIITVDENGNFFSTVGNGSFLITNDPGPGGLPNVLTYILPGAYSGAVQGDVLISGNAADGPGIFDIIRFNGNGTMI